MNELIQEVNIVVFCMFIIQMKGTLCHHLLDLPRRHIYSHPKHCKQRHRARDKSKRKEMICILFYYFIGFGLYVDDVGSLTTLSDSVAF